MNSLRLPVVVMALITAFVVTACGSSPDQGAEPGASSQTKEQETSPPTVTFEEVDVCEVLGTIDGVVDQFPMTNAELDDSQEVQPPDSSTAFARRSCDVSATLGSDRISVVVEVRGEVTFDQGATFEGRAPLYGDTIEDFDRRGCTVTVTRVFDAAVLDDMWIGCPQVDWNAHVFVSESSAGTELDFLGMGESAATNEYVRWLTAELVDAL